MGLFDFIKEAGQKLFGGGQPSPEDMSAKLKEEVSKLGLEAQGLDISVEGDKAVVSGQALSQEVREKIILAVGNTAGIGQVDDRMAVPAPAPEARFYTVKKGDTLSAIAKQFYGNAGKYPAIFEANRPMLTHPDKIYPGQVLRIPQL